MVRRGPRSGADRDRRDPLDRARPGARRGADVAYDRARDGVGDALRLARGMTYKAAAAGLDLGGGKGVICAPSGNGSRERPALRREMLLDFGDLVESLDGRYVTAEDVGIGPEDMVAIAERTSHVTGLPPAAAAPATRARSPRSASRPRSAPASRTAAATSELRGLGVVVLGLGHVGSRLAMRLAAAGARLTRLRHRHPQTLRSPSGSARAGSSRARRVSDRVRRARAVRARRGHRSLHRRHAAGGDRLRRGQQPARRRGASPRSSAARGDPLRARLHRQRRRPDQRLPRAARLRRGLGARARAGIEETIGRILSRPRHAG